MASINAPFEVRGSLNNLSFYRRRDSDKNIVREKWGPAKKQIETDPRYLLTRKNCTEWDGCSKGSKWIRRVLQPLDAVRDYNTAGTLTGLLKSIQREDKLNLYGQRSIMLSQFPYGLEGFALSQRKPFKTLLKTPLDCLLHKDRLHAEVILPPLSPGLNFTPSTPYPYFSIVASLGVVPDLHYTPFGYGPDTPPGQFTPVVEQTSWLGVKAGAPRTVLDLQLPYPVAYPSYSLVLAVAISFGTPDALGNIKAVRYCGSGYIAAIAS